MKVRKLETWADFFRYSCVFNFVSGHEIPPEYLKGENVWVLENDSGAMVGGFALIENKIPRSILQIPDRTLRNRYKDTCNELTAYFIREKTGSFLLTLRLIIEVSKAQKSLFVYSYKHSDTKLRDYYRHGNPQVIYIGRPLKLEGHKGCMPTESVEVLTKWGVVKIFLMRTFKHCKKILWGA